MAYSGHVRRNLCNDVTVSLGVDGAMSSDGQDAGDEHVLQALEPLDKLTELCKITFFYYR